MSDLADLFPDGTFTAGPETPADELTEPEEAEAPEESGADEPEGDASAAAEAVDLIDGKFKTQDDLLAAYHEAQRALHESRQPKEEEPEQEDEDPYGLWGTALGSDEAQQLAQRMIEQPHEAEGIVAYVQANQEQFGPAGADIYQQMYALWNAQNPLAAQQWAVDQRWAEHEARIAEQQAPIQSHYVQQMAGLAVHRATAELPRFAEFKDQIMETITSPNMQNFLAANPEYASDPQKMFEVLQGAWTNLIAQEYRTNQQHAATASNSGQESGTTEKAKPRTQQRSTAAAPATGGVEDLFPSGTFREG